MAIDNTELTEQLFKAIDTIIVERLRNLPYDKTIIATIINNTEANYGRYKVTTDDNITFLAYAELTTYAVNDKVYVRIPENDYTKQKVITGRYIPTTQEDKITEQKFSQLVSFQKSLKDLEEEVNRLNSMIATTNNFVTILADTSSNDDIHDIISQYLQLSKDYEAGKISKADYDEANKKLNIELENLYEQINKLGEKGE